MRSKGANEVRRFSRVATQRFDDAQFLLGHRNTAAVYLAGYAVECILKALWLSRVAGPTSARENKKLAEVMESFYGKKGHQLEWLRKGYRDEGGDRFPSAISQAFTRVNSWTTDLRYDPGATTLEDASGFLEAVGDIIEWARGRL